MKTWNAKPEEIDQKWWIVDANDKVLGRLATEITRIIRGKHRPTFTPHVDTGDNIIVINADKIKLTGNKWADKTYYRHSRFMGSLKETKAFELREKDPAEIIYKAVKGMLPKNKLSYKLIGKVKAYAGANHPHEAQKPETLSI